MIHVFPSQQKKNFETTRQNISNHCILRATFCLHIQSIILNTPMYDTKEDSEMRDYRFWLFFAFFVPFLILCMVWEVLSAVVINVFNLDKSRVY